MAFSMRSISDAMPADEDMKGERENEDAQRDAKTVAVTATMRSKVMMKLLTIV